MLSALLLTVACAGCGNRQAAPVSSPLAAPPILSRTCESVYRPAALAINFHHDVIVTSDYRNSVLTLARDSLALKRDIKGPKTLLSNPLGVAVDANGRIYVSNYKTNSVIRFSASADGNVSPNAILSGSRTLLNGPSQVQLDADGDIYVIESRQNSLDNQILEYRAGHFGNESPTRVLGGSRTMLSGVGAIRVDRSKNIFAGNFGDSSDRLASQRGYLAVFGSGQVGDTEPTQVILLDGPDRHFTIDAAGDLYILNEQNLISIRKPESLNQEQKPIGQIQESPVTNITDLVTDGRRLYIADYQNDLVCSYALP